LHFEHTNLAVICFLAEMSQAWVNLQLTNAQCVKPQRLTIQLEEEAPLH
jgi:hypothetical protein